MRFLLCSGFCLLTLTLVLGCAEQKKPTDTGKSTVDGSKYLLSSQPEGVKEVLEARKSIKDGDEVVVVGRIGGSVNPWVKGRAAFTIVDTSAKACSDIEGDECKTPWDYCCEANLPGKTTLVKVVDGEGKLVRHDARELLKVKELQKVVVRGKAKRSEGNLTILARGVYVAGSDSSR